LILTGIQMQNGPKDASNEGGLKKVALKTLLAEDYA
jgi:hypothetical protein